MLVGCTKAHENNQEQNENNKIYYTTTDGQKLIPYNTEYARFGAMLTSNTYENGQGTLVFDDAVTFIGKEVFYKCSNLKSIIIPNSVTSIKDYAFENCSNLASITIGNNITSVNGNAFSGFKNFKCKFASEDERCIIIDGTLNSFASAGLTEYTIPNNVTSIGEFAFYSCSNLMRVTIPDSVTSIGYHAFQFCSSLETITIPENVVKLGEYAFARCEKLTNVYCKPTTPPTGGEYLFIHNAPERKIYVPTKSVSAYQTASYWSDYANQIEAYNFGN